MIWIKVSDSLSRLDEMGNRKDSVAPNMAAVHPGLNFEEIVL